jgi:hypothetical protein
MHGLVRGYRGFLVEVEVVFDGSDADLKLFPQVADEGDQAAVTHLVRAEKR